MHSANHPLDAKIPIHAATPSRPHSTRPIPQTVVTLLLSALLAPASLSAQAAQPVAQQAPRTAQTTQHTAQHANRHDADTPSPLQAYVNSPDPHYAFELVATTPGDGFRTHIVRMTSQAWLTEAEVDQPIWWHWLVIVEPDVVTSDTALLFLGGGNTQEVQPTQGSNLLPPIATATHSVVAELRMLPNQPLTFKDDDQGPRSEDGIIAYGWDKFLRNGARDHDALWLARLPMTKAAVRAMDTVTAVMAGRGASVDHFVVTGGSKRGWATWTTAVVDDRVVAIAPMVIDLLNVVPSFSHHWRAYGFWSPAIADYQREGLMEWQGRPEYQRLLDLVDPYSYRDQLTLPKLLVNAAGDEFFLPDSWQFYWNDLVGEKHLRYVPNAGHSLAGTDVAETLGSFFGSIVNDTSRPKYSWSLDRNSTDSANGDAVLVTVDPEDPPTRVSLWQASNEATRDFRTVRIRQAWTETELAPVAPNTYRATLPAPASGWTAFFVELTYERGSGASASEFKVTSGVHVIPDALPFPEYEPDRSGLPEVVQ